RVGRREARTQGASIWAYIGATEDAASRRPARPGGTSVIVRRGSPPLAEAHAVTGSGAPRARSRSETSATPPIARVCVAAKPISTGRAPNADSAGPAIRRPSGIPHAQSVALAVIAFARIAGGI